MPVLCNIGRADMGASSASPSTRQRQLERMIKLLSIFFHPRGVRVAICFPSSVLIR